MPSLWPSFESTSPCVRIVHSAVQFYSWIRGVTAAAAAAAAVVSVAVAAAAAARRWRRWRRWRSWSEGRSKASCDYISFHARRLGTQLAVSRQFPPARSRFQHVQACDGVVLLALAALSAAQYHNPSQAQHAAILSEQRFLSGDGTFGAAYTQEDGVQFKEEADQDGNRRGSYSYVDPSGQRRTVHYTAGKDGFRASGDHLPVAPAAPHPLSSIFEAG
ncbi:Pupal cuticle protein Edg-78E [Gryllus bimaculatus]|nr:Pupal cuticle protein Edg-78E [Gryllus bimaculatus]